MKFNQQLLYFTQVGNGIPVGVGQDGGKKTGVRKRAVYRFVTTGTALYVRFGDPTATCANDGSEGMLLQPNTEYFFSPGGLGFVAFSRAIVPATDNFIEVS